MQNIFDTSVIDAAFGLKLGSAGVTSELDSEVILQVTLRGSMEEDLPCPRDKSTLCTWMMPNDFSPSVY